MNPAESNSPSVSDSGLPAPAAAEIDSSCRVPVMLLFVCAAGWGLLAAVLGLIASIKFHAPGLLADPAWLTYGRMRPASTTAMLYGFFIPAGLGVGLWILARLGRNFLMARWLILTGGALWNLGVAMGIAGILAGDATGFQNLEVPAYAGTVLFIGYLVIAIAALLTFHARQAGSLFVSHWFIFTALFWFAWIFSTAQVLLLWFPVRGVMQSVVGWWFSQNLRFVWLDLVGLSALFYFIPKLSGRPLHSRHLSLFAYWTLILFAPWAGIPSSAPVPAWMPTLSTVASAMVTLAIIAVALNLYGTTAKPPADAARNRHSIFFAFSGIAFVVSELLRIAGDLFDPTGMLHFTAYATAFTVLHDYGFFGVALFGAIYFIAPRLFTAEPRCSGLVRAQFWLTAAGAIFIAVPLTISGLLQAWQLASPSIPFAKILSSSLMFVRVSTLGDVCICVAQAILLANLVALVARFYRAQAVGAYATITGETKPAEVSA